MRRINVNLYPKDGYFFLETDGTNIRGQTWPGVVQRVINYRKRNGLPPGDPENEVSAQACKRNPILCVDEDPTTQRQLKITNLKGKVLAFLAGIRAIKAKKELRFVEASTAATRAGICAQCPNNQSLPEGCASCRKAVKEFQKEVLGTRPIDGRISGCIVTGEDLPTSTNLDLQTVDSPELPGFCWRKRGV
jgi:hypothetical protein